MRIVWVPEIVRGRACNRAVHLLENGQRHLDVALPITQAEHEAAVLREAADWWEQYHAARIDREIVSEIEAAKQGESHAAHSATTQR